MRANSGRLQPLDEEKMEINGGKVLRDGHSRVQFQKCFKLSFCALQLHGPP